MCGCIALCCTNKGIKSEYSVHCVTLHLVGYILEYYYDARTHES